jgi:hypothetical protein
MGIFALRLFFSSSGEKIPEKESTFLTASTFLNPKSMVQPRVVLRKLHPGNQRPCLGISGSKDNSGNPGLNQGPHTHDTGLNGTDSDRSGQSIIVYCSTCLAQRLYFGMSCGVMPGDRSVVGMGQKAMICIQNHRSNRDFA